MDDASNEPASGSDGGGGGECDGGQHSIGWWESAASRLRPAQQGRPASGCAGRAKRAPEVGWQSDGLGWPQARASADRAVVVYVAAHWPNMESVLLCGQSNGGDARVERDDGERAVLFAQRPFGKHQHDDLRQQRLRHSGRGADAAKLLPIRRRAGGGQPADGSHFHWSD